MHLPAPPPELAADAAYQAALLAAALDAAPDGVLVVGADGRMLSFNRRFVEMWRIPEAVVASGSDAAALQAVRAQLRDPDGFLERVAYLYAHPAESSRDEIHLRDGRVFDRYSTPVLGAEGRNHGRIWFFREVSEAWRAEQRLRESEARFRALADTVPSIVWTAAPDGTITYANDQWFRFCGLTPEQNARRWPELVLHPDDRERCLAAWTRSLREGGDYEIEVRNRRHDGEYRWFLTRAVALRDADGRVAAWFGTSTDIHERKRAEEQLRAARAAAERAAAVARALQEATIALGAASSPQQAAEIALRRGMAAVGAAAGIIFLLSADGQTLDPVFALGFDASVPRDWRHTPIAADAAIAEVIRHGTPIWLRSRQERVARYPHLARSPTTLPFQSWAVLPMLLGERPVGSFVLNFAAPQAFTPEERHPIETFAAQAAQTIERIRLQAEMERAQQAAEEANRAKSAFLAAMSHEFRTPLNAIAGHVQLLEMGLRGPVTEAQREALERIQRNQRHLLALVNDVLNFAKLEAGRVEYALREVALAEVVADVAPMIEPQLAAKGVGYEVRVPPAQRVQADPEKLQQILLNLLSNALKFTDAGGHVTVDTALREAGPDGGRPDVVFLRVHDTGIGIPRERQDAVFDPFVQVHRNLTRTVEGSGLGLAISRDLARGMGGELRVRSSEGVGSVFTLTLPRAGGGAPR